MGSFLVNSRYGIAFSVSVKNCCYLVSVIPWILHADNRIKMAFQLRTFFQFLPDKSFFFLQLLFVGQIQIPAAAALLFIWTLCFSSAASLGYITFCIYLIFFTHRLISLIVLLSARGFVLTRCIFLRNIFSICRFS